MSEILLEADQPEAPGYDDPAGLMINSQYLGLGIHLIGSSPRISAPDIE